MPDIAKWVRQKILIAGTGLMAVLASIQLISIPIVDTMIDFLMVAISAVMAGIAKKS